MKNLFTPTFGKIPLILAGRDALIGTLTAALENGETDPNLSSIIVGARGTGKTVLLSYMAERSKAMGWIPANVNCSEGMLEDILIQLQRAGKEFLSLEPEKQLRGVTLGQVGVEWDKTMPLQNWRSRMTDILEQLSKQDIGVLITIDEVNPGNKEMITFASVYQHFVRENHKVALIMAGLPHQVSQMLSNREVSFLRRSQYHMLQRIPDGASANAFEGTIRQAGRSISEEALSLAVQEADGFPYMIQLIGYRIFGKHPERPEITLPDVREGVKEARREMADHIYRVTYMELSDGDLQYLRSMMEDEKVSRTADIAARMNCQAGYASRYRQRLLEHGVIRSPRRGYVEFDMPGFREFLEENMG